MLFLFVFLLWILGVGGHQIVIGGGSLSALAAAITSANLTKVFNLDIDIILIEPTDWPGGQLTASNVPPDFGKDNNVVENLPSSFVNILQESINSQNWKDNPGHCWVSLKCFQAQLASQYLREKLLPSFPRLKVLYNTVIKKVIVDESTHRITSIQAIQRSPVNPDSSGYENLFSQDVHDWYTTSDSPTFKKQVFTFDINANDVVIEGTELGDIISTAKTQRRSQGVETPTEESDDTDDSCGQSTVFPFYIEYSLEKREDVTPAGSDGGKPFSLNGLTWDKSWTYRRAFSSNANNPNVASPGDISNQNLNNDYTLGYPFASSYREGVSNNNNHNNNNDGDEDWKGGLNITVLAGAEQRSFGYFHYIKDTAANSTITDYLYLTQLQAGTKHGLSKMPYLRDSRRVKRGLDGFRLLYQHLNYSNPDDNGKTAYHFEDTVGIGTYYYADIHSIGCNYPPYVTSVEHPVKPFYIPFRALTSEDLTNLLVSGKSMAQSFLANAATRLHPVEFSSGVAAGAAAFGMIQHGWRTTRECLAGIPKIQQMLQSDHVKSPIQWTL